MAEPTAVGPCRLGERRSRGRGGAVYDAQDAAGKPVLVHLLPPRLRAEAAGPFQEAARRLAAVRHHEVVRVLDAGVDNGRLYWVAEPFPGEPLTQLLRRRRLNLAEAFAVWRAILRALGAAHAAGVLHRGLHPGEVLVTPDLTQVQVTGFELAPSAIGSAGTTGTLATGELDLSLLAYLAPEQLEGRPAEARSDLYAAGAVLHEMLTGRPPGGKSGLPSQLNPELSSEVDLLLFRCLARDPAGRPPDAFALLDEVERLEEVLRLRLLTEIKDLSRSTSHMLGSRKVLIAVVVLAVLAVAAVLLIF
jgi:eukaryotic-like serine/threonine-protein kinase